MKPKGSLRALTTIMGAIAMVSACVANAGSDPNEPPDQLRVVRGEELYQQYCASCHRTDLSGDPEWKTPKEDGSYPPPPHDSTGHTWHHSDQVLLEIIRDGSDFAQSRMPSFGERLSDDDIGAILEFFKANWGPEEREYQRQINEQQARLGE
ncbi:MAG: c-type cytochrome [Acidimicrobiia bacterium]